MKKTKQHTVRLSAEQLDWLRQEAADERENAGYDHDLAKWDMLTDLLEQLDAIPLGQAPAESVDWLAPATATARK